MSWNSRTNRIPIKWVNHNGWIDIFVIKKTIFLFVFSTYLPVFLLKFRSGELLGCRIWFRIQRDLLLRIWVKTQGDMLKIRNKKSSFLLWQICKLNHYGWLILLKFYWFLNSNSQNLLLACFIIRPILDPKFPLMRRDWIVGYSPSIIEWIYSEPLKGRYHRGYGLNHELISMMETTTYVENKGDQG